MRRLLWIGVLLAAGCSDPIGSTGSSTVGGGSGTGVSTAQANTSGSGGDATATSGTNGGSIGANGSNGSSGGECLPIDAYAGTPDLCCSRFVDVGGYCATQTASGSGSGGTTSFTSTNGSGSTSATSAGGTGTTTGGTCPSNMPDLVTGQGGRGVGPCQTGAQTTPCPKGYQCIDGQCTLNSSSTLQVTLSFDDIEDFDLHLLEPLSDGGYCEIFYGNAGTNPDAGGQICNFLPQFCQDGGFNLPGSGNPCPVGWLDRDSNAACGGNSSEGGGAVPDGVNVENILFPTWEPPPSGTYYVRVDYWENCDQAVCSYYSGMDPSACNGHSSSHLGLQVRTPDSAIWQYCPDISLAGQGPNDHGANGASFADNGGAGSGFFVTSFTVP